MSSIGDKNESIFISRDILNYNIDIWQKKIYHAKARNLNRIGIGLFFQPEFRTCRLTYKYCNLLMSHL